MGGPGTASLLSAIGGAGASTAGALTGKGDAGQPLVNLSQSLNQQDQQRAQLAQQQQQNALQLRRQEIQDARQNFYIQQAVKTGAREDARDVRNIESKNIMQMLQQEAGARAGRGEVRDIIKKDADANKAKAAEAERIIKNTPFGKLDEAVSKGDVNLQNMQLYLGQSYSPKQAEAIYPEAIKRYAAPKPWYRGFQEAEIDPKWIKKSEQPSKAAGTYNPATGKIE